MPRTHSRDLAGKRFGRLTVIEETERRGISGQIIWRCHCSCGTGPVYVMTSNLTCRNTQSCGCWQRERSRQPNHLRGGS